MRAGLRFDLNPYLFVVELRQILPDHVRYLAAARLDRPADQGVDQLPREFTRIAVLLVKLLAEFVDRGFKSPQQFGIVAQFGQPFAQIRGDSRSYRLRAEPIDHRVDSG